MSNAIADGAASLVRDRRCALDPAPPALPESDADVRRWLARVRRGRVAAVLALWCADVASFSGPVSPSPRMRGEGRGEGPKSPVDEIARFTNRVAKVDASRPPLTPAELAIDGKEIMRQLGIPAGRAVGDALRHALDRVLDDPSLNTPEALASELLTWWGRTGPKS
jgi:hypothetical protein